MQDKTLKDKKILVTGITGFVGSNLQDRLLFLGAKVYGVARNVNKKDVLTDDILNRSSVENFIRDKKIDICFHLAGESLVESGKKDPYDTFRVNIEGTLNILDIARKCNLERIIVASTSHVYGHNKLPYYEGYTPRPTRPYETSKACTDLIAQSYRSSFNLPVLIPRFVNIYGPGDLNFTRLIPKTIRSVLQGKSPTMWGGTAVRDYLYIEDAIDAYIDLVTIDLKKVGDNCIFNFGSGTRISVEDLIKQIIKISEKKVSIKKVYEEREEEIQAQYVSFNKAKKLLRWKANTNLDEGLKKTIAWYGSYLNQ